MNLPTKHHSLFETIENLGQKHILQHWPQLNEKEQQHLFQQLQKIDLTLFQEQQNFLFSQNKESLNLSPFQDFQLSGKTSRHKEGASLLKKGSMACLIVAGGQGSRLQLEGPKGKYPVSCIKKKTLFQLFAEKTLAASKCYRTDLFIAVMTSPLNHEETIQFFTHNQFFGLQKHQVDFFCQKTLPILDEHGNLFLQTPSQIAIGPNGNGYALHEFYQSGIWKKWQDLNVCYVNLLPIDNPLADPFDAELLGLHAKENCDISIKAIKRSDPKESVGLIAKDGQNPIIVEYTEISPQERDSTDGAGNLTHPLAGIGLFCFSMDFIQSIALEHPTMPFHLAKKSVSYLSPSGKPISPKEPNAWKFETFIFDVLPLSKKTAIIAYPRQNCFSPLKSLQAPNDIHSVRAALLERDRHVFASISGYLPDPNHIFELAQEFYYPSQELHTFWKNKPLPKLTYISER